MHPHALLPDWEALIVCEIYKKEFWNTAVWKLAMSQLTRQDLSVKLRTLVPIL